jgi:transketolase
LIYLYDDNGIQLDGPTSMAWSEDVPERFDAYGWHTQRVEDGNDLPAIAAAIEAAQDDPRPSLIAVRTHIGYGSPNRQDTQKAHGSPLGEDEVRLTKEFYGWDPDKHFYVPDDVREQFDRVAATGHHADQRLGASRRELSRGVPGSCARAGPAYRGRPARRLGGLAAVVRDGHGAGDAQTRRRRRSRPWPGRCRSCSAAPPTCPSRT